MILGIESTAHTFSTAVINNKKKLLSQTKSIMKTKNKGLIPRELFEHHYANAEKNLMQTLNKANIELSELKAISFSQGPGIPNALKIGAITAKTLSKKLEIKCIPVNHCMAHIESSRIQTKAKKHVTVFVSGANTQLIVKEKNKYVILGETLDIGLGNLLDSFARKLGYGFPGGPIIDKLYFQGKKLIELPYTVKGTDIVFSGLLTAASKLIDKENKEDLSYSLMETAYSMLGEAIERIQSIKKKKNILITGGVAASKALRQKLSLVARERRGKLYAPSIDLCMDNAFMIALLGLIKFRKKTKNNQSTNIKPYQRIDEI